MKLALWTLLALAACRFHFDPLASDAASDTTDVDAAMVTPFVPAPTGCDLDGDGLPPVTCVEHDPSAFTTVACVCASPPCGAPCQQSATFPSTALANLGAITGPTLILVDAGTYAMFFVSNAGTSPASPIVIAARCTGSQRAPVHVISDVTITATDVTLEGFDVTSVYVGDTVDGHGDRAVLRELSVSGTVRADGADQGLIEDVDLLDSASGLYDVTDWTVRRTSTCNAGGWFARGTNIHFDRVLVQNNDRACIEAIPIASPGLIVEDSVLKNCLNEGVRVSGNGAIIRNNQISGSDVGIEARYAGAGDVTIFNNLMFGNITADLALAPPSGTGMQIEWNSLLSTVSIDASTCSSPTAIAAFRGNLIGGDELLCNAGAQLSVDNAHVTADPCTCNVASTTPVCASASACIEPQLITVMPMFSDPFYHLSQPPNEGVTSPAVDASGASASVICSGSFCLDQGTTSSANTPDTGPADLGYHSRIP